MYPREILSNFGIMDAKNYIFLLFPIECVSPLRYTLSMFRLLIHPKATLCFLYTAKGSISSAMGTHPFLSFFYLPPLTHRLSSPYFLSSFDFSRKGAFGFKLCTENASYSQTTFLPHSTDKLFTRHSPLCTI